MIGTDGKPLVGAGLSLGYQIWEPQPTMLETAATVVTGADGTFAFEGINFEMPNRYWLIFAPAEKSKAETEPPLPSHRIPIDADTPLPVEMRLP